MLTELKTGTLGTKSVFMEVSASMHVAPALYSMCVTELFQSNYVNYMSCFQLPFICRK